MHEEEKHPARNAYPTGRGYGNDYMRGGEVFGGYGYSNRPEYERRRGDMSSDPERRRADARNREDALSQQESPA
jgi:hypothetical protein